MEKAGYYKELLQKLKENTMNQVVDIDYFYDGIKKYAGDWHIINSEIDKKRFLKLLGRV